MVVENPYTQPHYLTMFFPVEPKVIIQDRHAEGDYFKKPTQFFFVNCDPEQNVVMTPVKHVDMLRKDTATKIPNIDNIRTQVKRSLIQAYQQRTERRSVLCRKAQKKTIRGNG